MMKVNGSSGGMSIGDGCGVEREKVVRKKVRESGFGVVGMWSGEHLHGREDEWCVVLRWVGVVTV